MFSAIKDVVGGWSRAFLPFQAWVGELRSPATLKADIIAGITVALVLVPQSMAYASLAGLPAYIGLYASFIPVAIAAIFGSSRQLATGTVAVVSLMTAAALGPLVNNMGLEGDAYIGMYMTLAAILALCVGIFQLGLGLFRMGVLVDFLSHPVVVGFTNGAAIIIATSQLDKIFGVPRPVAMHSYEQVWGVIVYAATDAHLLSVAMGLTALGIIWGVKKMWPLVPNVLTAVVVTTLASYLMGYQDMGGKVIGHIPEGLPAIKFPMLDMSMVDDLSVLSELLMPAVLISLIGFMEAISIAKAMAAQTRQHLDPNQELVGQGLSNITAGLFQAYPVSGSFSRSAVNISAGAITGFSSIVTGVVVAITLLFLTPLLYHLPQATLAAVIIMAVINLVKFKPIKHAFIVQPHDGWVAILTFFLTLVLAPHVEYAIMVGVALSLGLYLYRTMHPRFAELTLDVDGTLHDAKILGFPTCDYVSVLRFDGSLYFANAGYFEHKVLANVASKPNVKYVILDAEGINQLDATGEGMLKGLAERLGAGGVNVYFARAKRQILDIFKETGFISQLGDDHFYRTCADAIAAASRGLTEEELASSPICGASVALRLSRRHD